MENYYQQFNNLLASYAPKLIGAILVLIIGLWLARIITRWVARLMKRREIDPSLHPFLRSLTSVLLKTLVIVSALGVAGVQMASFIAILAAAFFAIGLALSGTLQNFAGGVIILILRPFKVGDWIEAQGFAGTVKEIQIFNTMLKAADNRIIFLPNGNLSTQAMVNFSREETRRVDWTFGIGYGDDSDKAREVLDSLIKADSRILTDPKPFVAISALADSSVNFVVRAWVKAPDYSGVLFDMNENVYKRFGKEDLNIPYPQMDVHLHQ